MTVYAGAFYYPYPITPPLPPGPTEYADILLTTYGADEVWRLVDMDHTESADMTIPAQVTTDRDGSAFFWDFDDPLQAESPVAGESLLAPFSNADTDYGDINTTSLNGIFDGTVGSAFLWLKIAQAATWTDSTERWAFTLFVDVDNFIVLLKSGTSNLFEFAYFCNAALAYVGHSSFSPTDWFSVGVSWKDSANGDEFKAYVNGSQVGTTQAPGDVFVGSTLAEAVIGADAAPSVAIWRGSMAYVAVKFGSVWTADDFAGMHSAAGA